MKALGDAKVLTKAKKGFGSRSGRHIPCGNCLREAGEVVRDHQNVLSAVGGCVDFEEVCADELQRFSGVHSH